MSIGLNDINVVESKFIGPGQMISDGRTVYMHPLDLLRTTRPELSTVERLMVLVDRNIADALKRLGIS